MRKRKGFTLVELLVVIGIIAVLISILLPVLNKAKQQAYGVKCESNMKQLMYATTMYEATWKGQIPFANWGAPEASVYRFGWLYATMAKDRKNYPIGQGGGPWTPHPPIDGVMTGELWPYVKALGIYHCPITDQSLWVHTNWLTDYLMNGAMLCYGATGPLNPTSKQYPNGILGTAVPGLKVSQFRRPSECVIYFEALEEHYEGQTNTNQSVIWNDGSSYPKEENLSDRHRKGANVAFLDGHVEWWDQTIFHNYAYPIGQAARFANPLWCSPQTTDGH